MRFSTSVFLLSKVPTLESDSYPKFFSNMLSNSESKVGTFDEKKGRGKSHATVPLRKKHQR
jgi:hypothetical protein